MKPRYGIVTARLPRRQLLGAGALGNCSGPRRREVQPLGNDVVRIRMTGADVRAVLFTRGTDRQSVGKDIDALVALFAERYPVPD